MNAIKISLLLPLVLSGCATWHGEMVIKNDHLTRSNYIIDAKVCYHPRGTMPLVYNTLQKDYYLNVSTWYPALIDELKHHFREIEFRQYNQNVSDCDFILDSGYTINVNPPTNEVSGGIKCDFINEKDFYQNFNIYQELPVKKYDLSGKSTEEKLKTLAELGTTALIKGVRNQLNAIKNTQVPEETSTISTANPIFNNQINSPDRIVENPALGISLLMDDTFSKYCKIALIDEFMKSKRVGDGPTMLFKWHNYRNSFNKIQEEDKHWLLEFKVNAIEEYEPGKTAIILYEDKFKNNKFDTMFIDLPNQESINELAKFKPGSKLLVSYYRGSYGHRVTAQTYFNLEVANLKKFAIRFLSGEEIKPDSHEITEWNKAKRALATALAAEKKLKLDQCYYDESRDPDRQVYILENCLNRVKTIKRYPKVSQKEINQQLNILDRKMTRIKEQ